MSQPALRLVSREAHWSDALPPDTCDEARAWARRQPSYLQAWLNCQRADWLLWLASRCPKTQQSLCAITVCAVECAMLAAYEMKSDLVFKCLDTVRKWAWWDAQLADVQALRREVFEWEVSECPSDYEDGAEAVYLTALIPDYYDTSEALRTAESVVTHVLCSMWTRREAPAQAFMANIVRDWITRPEL